MKTISRVNRVAVVSSVFFLVFTLSFNLNANPIIVDMPDYETELNVEAWMTDMQGFGTEEPQLETEAWMTDLENYISLEETEVIALEGWMMDLSSYGSDEHDMEVENWMTSMDSYQLEEKELLATNDPKISTANYEFEENSMSVETWMTCLDEFFSTSPDYLMAATDEPLELERWMTSLYDYSLELSIMEGIKTIELEIDNDILMALR